MITLDSAKLLDKFLEKYDALIVERWYSGVVRLYSKAGKWSRIKRCPKFLLNILPVCSVWINTTQFTKALKHARKQYHPDICSDKFWGHKIFQQIQTDLVRERHSRYRDGVGNYAISDQQLFGDQAQADSFENSNQVGKKYHESYYTGRSNGASNKPGHRFYQQF